jgi:hypothetical protein
LKFNANVFIINSETSPPKEEKEFKKTSLDASIEMKLMKPR